MEWAHRSVVTGREAASLLEGALPVREHARLVLAAGFAGPALRTPASLLYDETTVRDLAAWPLVDGRHLAAACPHGLYVARLSRSSRLDATSPWSEVASAVAVQPPMSAMTMVLLGVRVAAYDRLPWVATLCGYVALCTDCVAVRRTDDGRSRFVLEPPGAWSEGVTGRRLPTRRGTPGVLWHPLPVRRGVRRPGQRTCASLSASPRTGPSSKLRDSVMCPESK